MGLKLNKPLVVFDIEATGLNVSKDRIVEISILKLAAGKDNEIKTWRINPTIPIPDNIVEIHGITNEMTQSLPPFKGFAKEILNFIGNADLCGFSIYKFDLPILMEEFIRAGVDFDISKRKVVDVQTIFHKKEKRNLAAAYRFYCKKELKDEHRAEADTKATYEVFMAQMEKYDDLEENIEYLDNFSGTNFKRHFDLAGRMVYNDEGTVCFNFGKYRGKAVFDIFNSDPSYYSWIMNGDFPEYTKKKLTELKLQHKLQQQEIKA